MNDNAKMMPHGSKRVAIHTLGCKLNHAESSAIGNRFVRDGFDLVEMEAGADVIVINSCTVTENADRECRQIVRRALRANPDSCVIVTGCYAQLQPERIASIDGVDFVLGSSEKFKIFDLVPAFEKVSSPTLYVGEIGADDSFGHAATAEGDGRTRAFLKVQDGCDYNCSFCTIPLARGASRSRSVDETIRQARALVDRGYREIVLTGVNTGDYGRKIGTSLQELLVALHDVDGLQRLRISSIEPNLLSDEIIALTATSPIMVPHFHIPLQSGSDGTLARMRRRYRSADYRRKIETIVDAMPDVGIGIDVIVGFPGEEGGHFAETRDFLLDLPFHYLHVFTYSERENTPARGYEGRVPVDVRRARTREMREISERRRRMFAEGARESVRPVLFEAPRGDGSMQGYTDNYIRVAMQEDASLTGRIIDVRIGEWEGEHAACMPVTPLLHAV